MAEFPSALTLEFYREAKDHAVREGHYPAFREVQDIPNDAKPQWAHGLVERQHVILHEAETGDWACRWVHPGVHLVPASQDAAEFLVVVSPEKLRAVAQFRARLQQESGKAYIAIPESYRDVPYEKQACAPQEYMPWLATDLGVTPEDYQPKPHEVNPLWLVTWLAPHVTLVLGIRGAINNMYIGILPRPDMATRFHISEAEAIYYYPKRLEPCEEDDDWPAWREAFENRVGDYSLPCPLHKGYNGWYVGIPGTFVYYSNDYPVRPFIDLMEEKRVVVPRVGYPNGWLKFSHRYNESWSAILLFEFARTKIWAMIQQAEAARIPGDE